jgi:hypothetical protein
VWLHPGVWRRYAQLLWQGRRPAGPAGDTRQLGGDAVVDSVLTVRWVYRQHGPEDRPSPADIRAALDRTG